MTEQRHPVDFPHVEYDIEEWEPEYDLLNEPDKVYFPQPRLSKQEHAVIRKKAWTRVVGKMYENDFYSQIERGEIDDPAIIELAKRAKERNEKSKSIWVFITVNIDDDQKLDLLIKQLEKLTKKVWVTDYIYSIEQRSEIKNEYKGFHSHIYIKRNGKPPSELTREIRNTFKHLVGNDKAIDIKYDLESSYKNRVNYILGIKKDNTKMEKCQIDADFRKSRGLREYYASNDFYVPN